MEVFGLKQIERLKLYNGLLLKIDRNISMAKIVHIAIHSFYSNGLIILIDVLLSYLF